MNIHKDCSTLSIWAFYEALNTNDLRYLIKGFEKGDDIKIKDKDSLNLSLALESILKEYSVLTLNKEIIKNYKLQLKIALLNYEYLICAEILKAFSLSKEIEVLLLLNEFNHKIDATKNIDNQICLVLQKLKSLKNNIKIHEINYEKKFVKNNKEVKYNLDKEAMFLEMSLKLSYSIDTKKTSVERWVNLMEINREKQLQNG